MGFEIFESPEVESDQYNFELLNMPQHHPARDMWDTFYVNETTLLRTHTSPGQIHAMKGRAPEPIRVVLPGRVFRYEAVSARSEFMFYQVEGIAVGRNVTMAQLKGLLESFASQMYGGKRRLRLRGSYFPFTEPSVEVDMDCILCGGKGCRICKGSGWLEIAGAGMIHPTRARKRRLRPGGLLRLRVRDGSRAHRDAGARDRRHPVLLLERPALPGAVLGGGLTRCACR